MDLTLDVEDYKLNIRAGGVIIHNNKILTHRNINKDHYCLPGGRIEMNEDSKSAIKREIKEELDYDLDYELCSIQENFVCKDGINIMQYCFCYKAIYNENIKELNFKCLDNNNQTFYWMDINDIEKIKILPLSTKNLIQQQFNNIQHIIEK